MRTAFIHDVGYLMQDAGYRMPVMDAGVTLIPQKNAILDVRFLMLDAGCGMQDAGYRMSVMDAGVTPVPQKSAILDV